MNTFLKIAWRNIARNKFRSLITIAAVAVGLAALVFLRAFVDGADIQMVRNYTDLISGQVQIHKLGFHKRMGLERSISDIEKLDSLIKSMPDIVAYSKKIKDFVLLGSAEQSSGVLLFGIEPEQEKKVTKLHERIREGEFLSKDNDGQIVLGKTLLEILNVEVGDKVVVMGQAADGSLASAAYRICGVLDTGAEEIDKGIALITLKAAQDLFVMDGRISEFTLRCGEVYELDEAVKQLKSGLDPKVYEILSWEDISPMLKQTLDFDRIFFDIILFIVLMVVATGILNTILMGVLERIREFGIMLALGTKRGQIVLMVTLESLFLGLIGITCGLLLGVLASLYFGRQGIDLSIFGTAFESWYVGSVIYPRLFFRNLWLSSLAVFFISIVASLYPAWKAAKLKPVEAIRHFN